MPSVDLTPLVVYDVNDPRWKALPEPQKDQIRDWAREQGININDTWRLEIHLMDCPFARVYQYVPGPDGHWLLNEEQGEIVCLPPFDKLLSSMPPVRILPEGDR